ncbi:hypothetical protein DFH09DRAFT_1090343 [Mycena vulgaris]|nr:hypothetical protein DFH09DRAFT_1090343 [Mycena vulgaris]
MVRKPKQANNGLKTVAQLRTGIGVRYAEIGAKYSAPGCLEVLSEAKAPIHVIKVGYRNGSGATEGRDRMSPTARGYAVLCRRQYSTKENQRLRSEQRRQEQENATEVDRIRTPEIEVVFPASGSVWLQACLEREKGEFSITSDSLGTAGLNTFADPFERWDSNPGSRPQSSWIPFDVKRARSVQHVRLIGLDTNLAILQTNQCRGSS